MSLEPQSTQIVHFVYLGAEPEHNREFDALCSFLPRLGDLLVPQEKWMLEEGELTVVHHVCHRFLPSPTPGGLRQQKATVILRDATPSERGRLGVPQP